MNRANRFSQRQGFMLNRLPRTASPLDRAIAASLLAMLALNVLVLAQQLSAAPALAVATSGALLA